VPALPDFLGKVAREWQSRRSDAYPCHSTGILTLLAGLDSTNCGLGFCNEAILQRIMHLNEKRLVCLQSFTTRFLFKIKRLVLDLLWELQAQVAQWLSRYQTKPLSQLRHRSPDT
jgi:hypothetical protein